MSTERTTTQLRDATKQYIPLSAVTGVLVVPIIWLVSTVLSHDTQLAVLNVDHQKPYHAGAPDLARSVAREEVEMAKTNLEYKLDLAIGLLGEVKQEVIDLRRDLQTHNH